ADSSGGLGLVAPAPRLSHRVVCHRLGVSRRLQSGRVVDVFVLAAPLVGSSLVFLGAVLAFVGVVAGVDSLVGNAFGNVVDNVFGNVVGNVFDGIVANVVDGIVALGLDLGGLGLRLDIVDFIDPSGRLDALLIGSGFFGCTGADGQRAGVLLDHIDIEVVGFVLVGVGRDLRGRHHHGPPGGQFGLAIVESVVEVVLELVVERLPVGITAMPGRRAAPHQPGVTP